VGMLDRPRGSAEPPYGRPVEWLNERSTGEMLLLVVGGFVGLSVVSAVLTSLLVRFGIHTPMGIRMINRLRDKVIGLVKRPVTIMVLDEVADVIQTGHYTRNISDAIIENHDQIKGLVTEKVRQDPSVRLVQRLPGYDTVVSEVTETTLRVLIEMLGDPRMDELVSDLLRNNLQQIKRAVRDRDHERVNGMPAPDITPEELKRRRPR
jgi:hypothetical protein